MSRKTLKEMPSWLVKIYRFNEYLNLDGYMPSKTNLCHFCRVIFFVVPFKLIVIAAVIIGSTFGVGYLVFIMVPDAGWVVHWIVWGIITGAFIFWYLADNYKSPRDMWDSISDAITDRIPEAPKWWIDVYDLLWDWIDAIHDRVCPLIELKDEIKEPLGIKPPGPWL